MKKMKIITTATITIIAAILCAAILVTVIYQRDWFASQSSANSTIVSEFSQTIVIDQTSSEEVSSVESNVQETSSTTQSPSNTSSFAQASSNSSGGLTFKGTGENKDRHPTSGLPYKQLADPETGISWDGVSPIVYTYVDGTTGTEKREGARYEVLPGMWTEVYVWRDDYGREYGTICAQCGKEVGNGCYFDKDSDYCSRCGVLVPAMTCHDCGEGNIKYCNSCGKLYGDGTNGTCISHWTGGDWVHDLCGATVPEDTCHTCGVPIVIESLPGTTVNSPSQLTDAHKNQLYQRALNITENNCDPRDDAKLHSVYAFVLTDNTLLSTKSRCICFFVVSLQYPGREERTYHGAKMFNISILDNGSISCSATIPGGTEFRSEDKVIEYFQKLGTDIMKIR